MSIMFIFHLSIQTLVEYLCYCSLSARPVLAHVVYVRGTLKVRLEVGELEGFHGRGLVTTIHYIHGFMAASKF